MPVYQGESVAPALPGESVGERTWMSSTLIAENGLHVILLLLVPILLTAITLLGLRSIRRRCARYSSGAPPSCFWDSVL